MEAAHLAQRDRTIRDRIKPRPHVMQEACETLAGSCDNQLSRIALISCSRMEAMLLPRLNSSTALQAAWASPQIRRGALQKRI